MMRRGFTLIELMIVVAILGVLTIIGGTGISRAVARAQKGGATENVVNAFQMARRLSIVLHCRHLVQMNGETYAPTTPVPTQVVTPSTLTVIRKGNCAATNNWYEATDAIVNTFTLAERRGTAQSLLITFGVGNSSADIPTSTIGSGAYAFGFPPGGSDLATGNNISFAFDDGSGFAASAPISSSLYRIGIRKDASDKAITVISFTTSGVLDPSQIEWDKAVPP